MSIIDSATTEELRKAYLAALELDDLPTNASLAEIVAHGAKMACRALVAERERLLNLLGFAEAAILYKAHHAGGLPEFLVEMTATLPSTTRVCTLAEVKQAIRAFKMLRLCPGLFRIQGLCIEDFSPQGRLPFSAKAFAAALQASPELRARFSTAV